MKHLFKKVTLALGVLLMTFSCQKDDNFETTKPNQKVLPNYVATIGNSNSIIGSNKLLRSKIDKFSISKNNRTVQSNKYGFSIDTTRIRLIQTDFYDSYTFVVERDTYDSNIVENYVLTSYHDGIISQYLIAYPKTSIDGLTEIDIDNANITSIYDDNLLLSREQNCESIVKYEDPVCEDNKCRNNGGKQHTLADGDECKLWGTVWMATRTCTGGGWVETNGNCSGAGSGGGNDNDNPPGGGGTIPDDDNIIVVPLENKYTQKERVLNCLNGASFGESISIDEDIFNSISFGLGVLSQIENYLIDNSCSEESQQEVIEMIIDIYDEYQIINELDGKALCVYNKLKDLSGGFKNAIKKFEPEFPVAHLKFNADDNMSSNTKKAFTRPPENYVIDIVLNGNSIKDASYQKRPNLLVAKTIIHEVIHAEMFRKLLSLANDNGSIDVLLLHTMLQQNDYPGMLDYYFRNGDHINSNWQHQQMAAHYRGKIARMLQEFDTGVSVPNNQQPQQLYLDLSWEGLIYSDIVAWQQIMNNTERTRIENVISDYIANNINETCTE